MSDGSKTYTGSCYCGRTKVTAEGDAFAQGYCHCPSCRSFHGAPFMAWTAWPADAVRIEGEVRKTDKNPALARTTCASCGGKVAGVLSEAGVTVIFPNILAESGFEFRPQMHKYYGNRVMDVTDGLPKFIDGPAELGGNGETLPEVREVLTPAE